MPVPSQIKCPRGGFTLIELLVVIGLIAVLAGAIGLSLGKGDRGTSLSTAQSTISSLLSGARAQAALNQTNAAIFVNAEPTSDNFLREFRIAIETSANNWQVKGDPVVLPKGIYLVPPSAAFGNTVVEFQGTWTDLYTDLYASTSETLKDAGGSNISSDAYRQILNFKIRGTTNSAGKLVLSPGEVDATGKVVLNNPDSVRGMLVSAYGVSSFVNEPEAFK